MVTQVLTSRQTNRAHPTELGLRKSIRALSLQSFTISQLIGPLSAKHIAESDHRDETGNRIGKDGERSPQFFAFNALLIDEQREAPVRRNSSKCR